MLALFLPLLPTHLCQLEPVSHFRPLTVLHHYHTRRTAHPTAVITTIAIFETPAGIPVFNSSDRLQERIKRQVGKILLHVSPVLVQERAGIIWVWVHFNANHPLDVFAAKFDRLIQYNGRYPNECGTVANGMALL